MKPARPQLEPGDRVLVQGHHWVQTPSGPVWVPTGAYRWRVVARLVRDAWAGWCVEAEVTAPSHPSRELARHVVAVLRAEGSAPPPVQLGLFEVAS